jgi:hypothetical protein
VTTRFIYDGNTRRLTAEDIRCGHVLRRVDVEPSIRNDASREALPSFSDCIIVDMNTKMEVSLVRPYVRSEGADTTCRTWSAGFEQFQVSAFKLVDPESKWRIVLLSTGEPVKMVQ